MRGFVFVVRFLVVPLMFGLLWAAEPKDSTVDLRKALVGEWVGTLEYRDYSEPATSTKRVKLPTWLAIEAADELRFRYVYDDGPSKTVTDVERVRIDPAGARYQILGEDGKVKEDYAVAGLGALREGRGVLTLSGPGVENNQPVDTRTTIRIGRNILEITREAAPKGTTLVFRHSYTLVRALTPVK